MSAATTSQELLKMLATTAVTVLTSYQAITSHIDATVANEVRTSTIQVYHQIDRVKLHADSLHLVTKRDIRNITDSLRAGRVRSVTF